MPDFYFTDGRFTFVWDEDKNKKNIGKHGIPFRTAARVFDDDLRLEYPDPAHSEQEERYRTIGLVYTVTGKIRQPAVPIFALFPHVWQPSWNAMPIITM